MMVNISECCPPGMQVASPGGLVFDTRAVAAVECDREKLKLHIRGGGQVVVTFHRNVDGGPPDVFALQRNIVERVRRDPG